MNLSPLQIFIAVGIFFALSFVLIKLTYSYFKNKSGAKAWKIDGSRTGYFRITLLVSLLLTAVVMLVLKNTILS